MCFSAGASFAGGALISAAGVLTIMKNNDPARRVFASMPFVFGIQQISEGFVWIALQSPGHDLMLNIATYVFLFAAVVLWPSFVPASVLLMEKLKRRRVIIMPFLAVGMLVSTYYGIGLLTREVTPVISSHHIMYTSDFPKQWALCAFAAYLSATLIPVFLSSRRQMWLLGLLLTFSCLLTGIFYKEYLTSVWCFFAALISIVVLWIVAARETVEPSVEFVPGIPGQ
jgi:hypothetical protein